MTKTNQAPVMESIIARATGFQQGEPRSPRRTELRCFLAASVLLALAGCGAQRYALVDSSGIYFEDWNYRVRWQVPVTQRMLSSQWRLDNFRDDSGTLVIKDGARYRGHQLVERDGKDEPERVRAFLFDIKLDHRVSDATIWITNLKLSNRQAEKDLDALLTQFASGLTGTGLYDAANVYLFRGNKLKRHAAIVREKASSRLGAHPAITARIQILDLDQVKVEPQHQGDSLQVTLVKYTYEVKVGVVGDGGEMVTVAKKLPALMVVGYLNASARFSELLPEYVKFLSQISFDR
jgi:hypothetical protein